MPKFRADDVEVYWTTNASSGGEFHFIRSKRSGCTRRISRNDAEKFGLVKTNKPAWPAQKACRRPGLRSPYSPARRPVYRPGHGPRAREVPHAAPTKNPRDTHSQLSVASVNVFNDGGTDMWDTLVNHVREHEPDLVALQEAPTGKSKDKYEIEDYDRIVWGPKGTEGMAVFLRNNSAWALAEVQEFVTSTSAALKKVGSFAPCGTSRKVYLPTLELKKDRTVKVRVANVHLCGGKFDDPKVVRDCDKDLQCVKDMKIEPLEQVVDAWADIVLGDFNSDVHHYVDGKPNPGHRVYLNEIGWTDAHIEKWNIAPYEFLFENGYKLVNPQKTTSYYGVTPDTIWYNDEISLIDHGLLDMGCALTPGQGASDHDGIFATFSIPKP